MEYQLIAGIFFGVGICITGILIYNIIQSYAFDRNTRRIMHEELERKIESLGLKILYHAAGIFIKGMEATYKTYIFITI